MVPSECQSVWIQVRPVGPGLDTNCIMLKTDDTTSTVVVPRGGGGRGEYSDIFIFSLARVVLGGFGFWGFKILNFNNGEGRGSEKEYFLGVKILWIFLGGHNKIGLYLGIISMHFYAF